MTQETSTAVAIAERSLSVTKATEARLAVAEHLQAWDGLRKLGQIHMSTGLAPRGFDTPEKCALALLKAIEIGVPVTSAYQFFYVANGRVGVMAEMVRALVSSRMGPDGYIHIEESTPERATCVGYRKGRKPVRVTFTIQQAKAAGIYDKQGGTWKQWPAEHCVAKASIRVGRLMFPDILSGLPAFGGEGDLIDAEFAVAPEEASAVGGGNVEIIDGDFRPIEHVDTETGEIQPGHPAGEEPGQHSPAAVSTSPATNGHAPEHDNEVLMLIAEHGLNLGDVARYLKRGVEAKDADEVITSAAKQKGISVMQLIENAKLAKETTGGAK